MAKRITYKRVLAYIAGLGITSVAVIGLFSLIFTLGVADLKGNYTSNEFCGGETVCFLEMNDLCFNEDVFVYPMDGAAIINAQPADLIDEVHLYRGWGKGWREIPLDTTCTGTWCGGTGTYDAKYSYAFRKDKCYDLRIEVFKPENSTITWKINPSGKWLPLDGKNNVKPKIKETCTAYEKTITVNVNCVNSTFFNESTQEEGTIQTCDTEEQVVEYEGPPCTRLIEYGTLSIDFEKEGYNCKQKSSNILCDSFIDGNGDGNCQAGETCCVLQLNNGSLDCKNGRDPKVLVKRLKYE